MQTSFHQLDTCGHNLNHRSETEAISLLILLGSRLWGCVRIVEVLDSVFCDFVTSSLSMKKQCGCHARTWKPRSGNCSWPWSRQRASQQTATPVLEMEAGNIVGRNSRIQGKKSPEANDQFAGP